MEVVKRAQPAKNEFETIFTPDDIPDSLEALLEQLLRELYTDRNYNLLLIYIDQTDPETVGGFLPSGGTTTTPTTIRIVAPIDTETPTSFPEQLVIVNGMTDTPMNNTYALNDCDGRKKPIEPGAKFVAVNAVLTFTIYAPPIKHWYNKQPVHPVYAVEQFVANRKC